MAALAQLVEHRIRNAGVAGSSPASGTTVFPQFSAILRSLADENSAEVGNFDIILVSQVRLGVAPDFYSEVLHSGNEISEIGGPQVPIIALVRAFAAVSV